MAIIVALAVGWLWREDTLKGAIKTACSGLYERELPGTWGQREAWHQARRVCASWAP